MTPVIDSAVQKIARAVRLLLADSSWYHKFEAVYDVLDVVFGKWPDPQIQFVAYDHYGAPEVREV